MEEEQRLSLQPRRSMAEASSLDSEMPASPHSRKLRAPGASPPPAYVPSPSGHPMQNGEHPSQLITALANSSAVKEYSHAQELTAEVFAQSPDLIGNKNMQ